MTGAERPDDPATAYARDVAEGRVTAGPHVRAACRRHLRDLEEGPARGLRWDAAAARDAVDRCRDLYTVEVGDASVPFEPLPWQAFVRGSLFGWRRFDRDLGEEVRRFREAYVETGKGSGKSPLAASIGLDGMFCEPGQRLEIYSAATDRDQAMILYRDAVSMVQRSPMLRLLTKTWGVEPNVWQMLNQKTGAVFKPIPRSVKSGYRPYFAIIDEVHEAISADLIDMQRRGFKGHRSPLLFMITNSGSDLQSVCYELHEHAVRVAHGDVEDDTFFGYVCALDEGDDPFRDETCWEKANPSLDVTPGRAYLRRAVEEVRGLPSRENAVRRLNFCQWTDAPDGWLTREVWEGCEHPLRLEDYAGRECHAGLDLSYGDDLTALALVFPWRREDGETVFDLFVEFWKPAETLAQHERMHRFPYRSRVGQELSAPPGPRLKLQPVAQRLAQVAARHNLQAVAYDRYRIKDLETDLKSLGVTLPLVEHPQGFRRRLVSEDWQHAADAAKRKAWAAAQLWMPHSVQLMENAAVERRLRTPPNPLLRWNVMSVMLRQDPAGTGNGHMDKRSSLGKIDGAVAAAMAIGAATAMRPRQSYMASRQVAVAR